MQKPATNLNLTAVVTPDDDWFMARCVEVPVVSQGPTVDEALANLRSTPGAPTASYAIR
jgi:predicted RNase H-like HicB family nuclease